MKKRKVLIFIDWYLPGLNAGGPVRTCANMVSRLNDEFDLRIVTRNTDLKEDKPYDSVKSNAWNLRDDNSSVYYFSKHELSLKNIQKLIEDEKPDIIHLNSLFSLYFTLLPLIAIRKIKVKCKVVAGPRGMLSKGALAIKPLKKKIFIQAARITGLFKNVTWHASTKIEEAEIRKAFGDEVTIQLAIDLAPVVTINRVPRVKQEKKADLFFLGRVSQVKNLLQCITTLQKLDASYTVCYDIFGPIEEQDYWEKCQEEITKINPTITINYKGLIDHSSLNSVLSNYHFLFLLTENENYGHAIVESMVSGCPVIISDRTPWRNMSHIKAGWDLALEDNDAILKALKHAVEMNQNEYDIWSNRAYDKAVEVIESKKSVEDNKNLFR
ncbi:MAG: glycosyltransferase [Bacteroidetes bacterium]|nr:glycosyltransferase [Bacteroidota bacterium]